MSGEVNGCKSCGGSHFGHNECPFTEIAEACSKGETSAVPAAEKPEKELNKLGSAGTGGEKADE